MPIDPSRAGLETEKQLISWHWRLVCVTFRQNSNLLNGSTAEIWELISNSIQHIIMEVITYPCWD